VPTYGTLIGKRGVVPEAIGAKAKERLLSERGSAESEQARKFKELARQLEANEDEKAFEDKVRRIAKVPPTTPPKEAE
jgi:hypothetical protein